MKQQIDVEKLISVLSSKIAELELENAKMKVIISSYQEGETE